MDSQPEPQEPSRAPPRPSRRQVLAALGTAAATSIAGCSGGGGGSDGDGGGDTTTGSPDPAATTMQGTGQATDTTTGGGTAQTETATTSGGGNGVQAETCTDMTESFTTVDPGDRAFLFVGEFPSAVSEVDYYTTRNTSVLSLAAPDSATYGKLFEVAHRPGGDFYNEPLSQPDIVPEEYEVLTEITFAGRTTTAYINPANVRKTDAKAIIRLPYDYDDRTIWFENAFSVRAFTKDQGSISEQCAGNLRTSIELVIESLAENPDADPENP